LRGTERGGLDPEVVGGCLQRDKEESESEQD
jgi:hypothetical protein